MKLLKTIGYFIAQKCEEFFNAIIKPILKFLFYVVATIVVVAAALMVTLGAMTVIGIIAAQIYPAGFLNMLDESVVLATLKYTQWVGFYCFYGTFVSLCAIMIGLFCCLFLFLFLT